MDEQAYPRIPDYAFISDCQSLVLIGRDASVEWACFQRFDNRAVFARILDRDRGGYFRIAPVGDHEATRRYLPDTNVLETTFRTSSGVVTVTDCLPVHEDPDDPARTVRRHPQNLLVRMVHGVEGSVDMKADFHPRFEYGLTTPALEIVHGDLAHVTGGPDELVLQNGLGSLEPDDHGGGTATATVNAGDEVFVALTYHEAGHGAPHHLSRYDLRMRVDETIGFWTDWAARCRYRGEYREAVVRSALVLKGLTHDTTGAVIAAATTSLPEEIGGERNWDYRFTWLRDSSALLVALGVLGYREEAQRFADWVWRTTAGRADELQIMYGIGGERMLHEATLEHLDGYRGSQPVRVGNGAWNQFQLDTFGEVLGALYFFAATATPEQLAERPVDTRIAFMRGLLDVVVDKWQEPDEGIWETRGGRQHFVFSKLMAWIALDYGVQIVGALSDDADVKRWTDTRDEIRRRIEAEGVDPGTNAFMQAFGSTSLDAASLQVGLRDFLPHDDPRVVATVERIDKELTRNGHCYRYLDRSDGLVGGEGTFAFCTLWLVCALARIGRVEEAEARLEMVLGCASDLGLLAEEIDPDTGEQLGNYPQAFSHIGVIAAAATIELVKNGWTGGMTGAAVSDLFADAGDDVKLPVMPPVAPMLAKLTRELPEDGLLYEPKWDGFRCIVFRDGDEIELGSRNERPFNRYFPELIDALKANLPARIVLDGEIVIAGAGGLDFDGLQQRIHPAASRVAKLAEETPASFVAFDVLAEGDDDLRGEPFEARRGRLQRALAGARPPIHVTPATRDPALAREWFERFEGAGLDGVLAKPLTGAYRPNERTMFKVKHERTADCVVAGFRWHKDGKGIGSLLLGLYDAEGDLHHVGVASSFAAALRTQLVDEVAPYRDQALEGHPWREWASFATDPGTRMPGAVSRWNAKKDLSWEPLRIELVAEVRYEHMQGDRFRHVARFLRWRPDRDPRSCTYEQLEAVVPAELAELFGAGTG